MPNPNRPAVAIEFEGKTYPNRLSLARHLAALIGNSVRACESSLIRYKDDPTAVLEVFSRQRRPGAAFPVAVGGRPFRSKSAFYAYLRQHYGVSVDLATMWHVRGLSLDQVLERAREYRRKNWKSHQRSGPVFLFGWRFASLRALCRYYNISYGKGVTAEWRECRAAGRKAYEVPHIMTGIAALWSWGVLDERNRLLPEIERKRYPSALPRNKEIDEDTLDEYERRNLDCYQAEGVPTGRRLAMAAAKRQREAHSEEQSPPQKKINDGAALRDAGMAAASAAQELDSAGWSGRAYQAIVTVARLQDEVHTDDVDRIFHEAPRHFNAWRQ